MEVFDRTSWRDRKKKGDSERPRHETKGWNQTGPGAEDSSRLLTGWSWSYNSPTAAADHGATFNRVFRNFSALRL